MILRFQENTITMLKMSKLVLVNITFVIVMLSAEVTASQ